MYQRNYRLLCWLYYLPSVSVFLYGLFFFSSRRRHTRCSRDWEFRRVLFRSAPHGGEHFLLCASMRGRRNGLSHAPLGEPLAQCGSQRGGSGDVLWIGTARPEVEHAVSDL